MIKENKLTLQRASAGSGKTYSLARTYLQLLLGVKDENGHLRLRKPQEFRHGSAHSRLLAITFTNKATAEMRKRFIDNLAALAHADNPPLDDQGQPVSIDYLSEFCHDFHATPAEIAASARAALSDLLNHYSDFQVSTIDSFFQQILRSFAYEAELPDSYEVELDSERLVNLAFDSLLHTAQTDPTSEEHFWVNHYTTLLRKKGSKWNLTQPNGGPRKGLIEFLNMMESEDFKAQRAAIDHFFATHTPEFLHEIPAEIEKLGQNYLNTVYQQALSAIDVFMQSVKDAGVDEKHISKDQISRNIKVREANPDKYPFTSAITRYKNPLNKPGYSKLSDEGYDYIKELSNNIAEAIERWKAVGAYTDKVRTAVPVVMLVHLLQKHLQQYAADNNVVQLSDTNTILRKITADSDVPFIYEKIGNTLESYMIDEFQDTSRLQWENMKPLVDNSLGNANANLIIGDAKQSIYRFRNADSTLINTGVPGQYKSGELFACGKDPEENANWRSAPEIVRFNNSLFTYLAATLDQAQQEALSANGNQPAARKVGADIAGTYEGICQMPKRTKLQGYVELRSFDSTKKDSNYDSDSGEETAGDMPCLVPCINSLIERGYRPRDIAVLVRTKAEGRKAVKLILADQADKSKDDHIQVISDEALLISNAASVEIITTLLQAVKNDNIQSANTAVRGKGDARDYSRRIDHFTDALHRMRSNAPDLSVEERMAMYFACETPRNSIPELVKDSPSMALPALVERIIGSDMIPADMRRKEAAYISAFQDAIATFSERNQPDVASFLTWWDANKDSLSITSPEDADAVQVLTIHKAKGLEWPCVIMPTLTGKLSLSYREKDWLPVEVPFKAAEKKQSILPPVLPVKVSSKKSFMHTPWQTAYIDIESKNRLDMLNLIYVAFTRAKQELYVFMKEKATPKEGPADIRDYLLQLRDNTEWLPGCEYGMEKEELELCPESKGQGGIVLTYGQKPSEEYIAAQHPEQEKATEAEDTDPMDKSLEFKDYEVNMDIPKINYKVGDLPPHKTESDRREAIRLGDVEHAVLEGIRPGFEPVAEADRLLKRALIKGQITRREHDEMQPRLHALLGCGQAKEWFGPGVRVFAERSLRFRDQDQTLLQKRPDRVVVDPDTDIATVIDYKTGERHASTHDDQVRNYMRLLRQTGLFADVRGVLWYLNEAGKPGEFVWVKETKK